MKFVIIALVFQCSFHTHIAGPSPDYGPLPAVTVLAQPCDGKESDPTDITFRVIVIPCINPRICMYCADILVLNLYYADMCAAETTLQVGSLRS